MWNGFLIKIYFMKCRDVRTKLQIIYQLHFQFPFTNGINIPVRADLPPSEYLEAINKTNIK